MEIFRKYNWIKKILIPVIAVAIFLMPISPGLGIKKVSAAFKDDFGATLTIEAITNGSADVKVAMFSKRDGAYLDYLRAKTTWGTTGVDTSSDFNIQISEKINFSEIQNYNHPRWKELGYEFDNFGIGLGDIEDTSGYGVNLKVTFGDLKPNTNYYVRYVLKDEENKEVTISEIAQFKTLTEDDDQTPKDSSGITNLDDYNFGCNNLLRFSVKGCIAEFVYTIYSLSASVAQLAARFLDFLIYYSTNSSSYLNDFISRGWGAIRDVANIFFIIALLYIAIKTILGLGGHDTKKIVSTVIVVALLINFSLFFTQVIIDGSNILAKVFYNNITPVDENGKSLPPNSGKEKSISVGLVDKFDPQKIVSVEVYNDNKGRFIFIAFLALLITLYTAYIFFTVGLFFVARVVSLWIYMIFSPLAFASYTVPFDIPGFGHKEWWNEVLKNAFLAPIFIFFLYIIVMFAGFLNEIASYPDGADPMQKIMSVVIPFIILFVLLMKSKKLATTYAGEMGSALVKGAAVIGGLALGGAALGVAAIGRGTIGAFMKGASTGDTAARRLAAERASGVRDPSIRLGTRIKGNLQRYTGIDWAQQRTGRWINRGQDRLEEAQHARHELDIAADSVAKGKKWGELTGTQRYMARRKMARDRWVRDNSVAQHFGTRKWEALTDAERAVVDAAVGVDAHGNAIAGGTLATNTTWADTHWIREARHKQGLGVTLKQSLVTGSFDVRNLSKVVAEQQDTMLNKFASGLTSVLGNAMRGSIKSTFGAQYGFSQKQLFKDLGHTISEALKGAKIDVDLSHVGKVEKEGHSKGEHH